MSKRIIRYEDTQKIINGRNTVVYGQQGLRYNQIIEDVYEALGATLRGVTEKGVAKCNPDDEYVETKGKEIASKRAERAGNRELKKLLLVAIDRQSKLLDYLNKAVADLDAKFAELKLTDPSGLKSFEAEPADDAEAKPADDVKATGDEDLFVDGHPNACNDLDGLIDNILAKREENDKIGD